MSRKKYAAKSKSGEARAKDDLQRISGIGPAVEECLHKVGISTFAHLAALSPADIAAAVMGIPGLTADAIKVQDWIGQAHKLALHSPQGMSQLPTIPTEGNEENNLLPTALQEDNPSPATAQRTALFTVEIVLAKDNTVYRMSALHVQGLHSAVWEGWQAMPLLDFLVQQAEISLPYSNSTPIATEAPQTTSDGLKDSGIVPVETGQADALATKVSKPTYVLHLRELETLPRGANRPRSILPAEQPFDVRLTLDLTNVADSLDNSLFYDIVITAKRLEDQTRHIIGEAHGIAASTESTTITVEGRAISEGTYRLAAEVVLKTANDISTLHVHPATRLRGNVLLIH